MFLELYTTLGVWVTFLPRIHANGELPRDRSWHTLTVVSDDKLFLFGGLSSDNVPLSKYTFPRIVESLVQIGVQAMVK